MKDIFELSQSLAPKLRERGFRKTQFTWKKALQGTTVLFSVIRSKPDNIVRGYCFGTAINELCSQNITAIKHCHITQIFDSKRYGAEWTEDELLNALDYWEQRFGTLRALCISARQHSLPSNTSLNVTKHLLCTDMSKL